MPTKTTDEEKEYRILRRRCRAGSKRHVLVLEADMCEDWKRHVFHDSEQLRKLGNEEVATLRKRYEQLNRTKRYRKLKELYKKYAEAGDNDMRKDIGRQMREMQEEYHLTLKDCEKDSIQLWKKYDVNAAIAQVRVSDIWRGMEKVLYKGGENLRFLPKGRLPAIKAKELSQGVVVKVTNERLWFSYRGMNFTHGDGDRFINDETSAILRYLKDPGGNDRAAVEAMVSRSRFTDTYRPCYAMLMCKTIRGRLRVYVCVVVEGTAKPKYRKDGTMRHTYGTGSVGADIGTQTIAYTSDSEVGLENLAERGRKALDAERKSRLIRRAMDRSRRATNPDNFDSDGRYIKGPKKWHYSKRYLRLRTELHELERVCSLNRHYAVNETVNHLRSLGDTFVTESKNAETLRRKARPGGVDSRERPAKRKRFGRSIRNRCPGYMQSHAKEVFESTGGRYIEVPKDYRASQYDHTADDYIKKKLRQRMYSLSDGTIVQRDWYSSFLLYCIDENGKTIDKEKCRAVFPGLYEMEQGMINDIRRSHRKVLNSGIRVA